LDLQAICKGLRESQPPENHRAASAMSVNMRHKLELSSVEMSF